MSDGGAIPVAACTWRWRQGEGFSKARGRGRRARAPMSRQSQRARKGDVARGSFEEASVSLPGTPNPRLLQLAPDRASQRQLNGAWVGPKDKGTPVSQSQASAMAMQSVGQPKMLRRVHGQCSIGLEHGVGGSPG